MSGGERRLAAIPHLSVGEVRYEDVAASPGVAAHRTALVKAACGRELPTTLVTRQRARTRCGDCLAEWERTVVRASEALDPL